MVQGANHLLLILCWNLKGILEAECQVDFKWLTLGLIEVWNESGAKLVVTSQFKGISVNDKHEVRLFTFLLQVTGNLQMSQF